jgi:hypothetical protein
MLETSKNHLGPSLDYMLDNQKLPTQILEASFAFRQKHAGAQTVYFPDDARILCYQALSHATSTLPYTTTD